MGRGTSYKGKRALVKVKGALSDLNWAIIRGKGGTYQKWKRALLVPD